MSLTSLIANYSKYNAWANNKIANWLKDQDENLLQTYTESSFKTINLTIQHMLRTQKFWLAFVTQQHFDQFDWSVKNGDTIVFLEELVLVSEQMQEAFSNFSDEALTKQLELNMPWAKNSLSRYEYIIHVINHSTYHRGQIVTMARSLGLNSGIVNTDYNIFNTP